MVLKWFECICNWMVTRQVDVKKSHHETTWTNRNLRCNYVWWSWTFDLNNMNICKEKPDTMIYVCVNLKHVVKLVWFCFLAKPFFWPNKKIPTLKIRVLSVICNSMSCQFWKKKINVRSALNSVCKCVIIFLELKLSNTVF